MPALMELIPELVPRFAQLIELEGALILGAHRH